MKNFPLIGIGITTIGKAGATLDASFPYILFLNGESKLDKYFEKLNGLAVSHVFHAGVQLVDQLLGLLLVEALRWIGHVDQCGLPRRILSLNHPSMMMALTLFYL